MSAVRDEAVHEICARFGNDATRLLDVVRAINQRLDCIDGEAMEAIAEALHLTRADVEGVVSFYSFLSTRPHGNIVIRLCDDVIDKMKGADEIASEFEHALGIRVGETTPDGRISLTTTSCIGMSDQAPAALVNDVVLPRLSLSEVRRVVRLLQAHPDGTDLRSLLVDSYGGGNNAHDLVRSAVDNSIRQAGPVLFGHMERGAALRKALALSPVEVIRVVKASRLRGRGGGGFPTGVKWEHTRGGQDERYVVCNADEGEPGTFKDRVLLTERADLVFEGMTIAGYAIGASHGVLYLRAEYAYLREYLEHVLRERRQAGLLGTGLGGRKAFEFDIRIQMGAGAYICGEETALIESMEGKRGQPRLKPPFPASHGYLDKPTCVNNVETYCCAARILEQGAPWFSALGSKASTGTKLLSVSGDCKRPGVYEVPFGISVRELLGLCDGTGAAAVQIGGPSGRMVPPSEFGRTICFDDLATGGAVMVFDQHRDLLEIASEFLRFFIHESCGYCTPCRVGNSLLKERLDRIRAGHGSTDDVGYLRDLSATIAATSRCGLGWTSPNPVLSTLDGFPGQYERRLRDASYSLEDDTREARLIRNGRANGRGSSEGGCAAETRGLDGSDRKRREATDVSGEAKR